MKEFNANLMVLDDQLEPISIIDTFQSLIWVERYDSCGDFEIYAPVGSGILNSLRMGSYLARKDTQTIMIVESIEINADFESGDFVTITGRSLESILDRRIIWRQTQLSGSLQNGVKTLLEENILNPEIADRKIDNFIFLESTDVAITDLTLEAQFTGENLLDAISAICSANNIGFRVFMNEAKCFVFELYVGKNRSYDQTDYPYVVFSNKFDNILSSNYKENDLTYRNVALIGGEGEGSERRYTSTGDAKGLERRELFVDARDISSRTDDGSIVTEAEYNEMLKTRGEQTLTDHEYVTSFEGAMDTIVTFAYGKDFFMGDIVQIEDKYGNRATSRIIELVQSFDENGYSSYPTLSDPSFNRKENVDD